jgi:recombination protein RecA
MAKKAPPTQKKKATKKIARSAEQKDADKAVDSSISLIEKQFGKGAVMRLGERKAILKQVSVVPTGSVSLDKARLIGGLRRGRVVEIFGGESSGKTTLALHVVANAQRAGNDNVAFVDAEHALDTDYAKAIGVNLNRLLISQPDYGEQALEIVDMLVRSGGVSVVVVDSVAALTPKAEIEGEMGDTHIGLQARLMSQAMRKLTANVNRSNTLVIFINQTRQKIGVMFGSNVTTTGGTALKFYASVRLDIRRIGGIKVGQKDSSDFVGNRTRVKVVKNKLAPPFKTVEFDIIYGEGISEEGDILDLAVAQDVIVKSGAWYSYGKERIGQGRETARAFLRENPDMKDEIRKQLV